MSEAPKGHNVRKVKLRVMVVNELRCSDNCLGMSADQRWCHFFGEALDWQVKHATNGNRRLIQCRNAEVK